MISFCRRIPKIVSLNKRTLFCGTSKLSPVNDDYVEKMLKDVTKCSEGEQNYQLLRHGNLTLLQVSNESRENDNFVACSILVGVGFNDDNYLGLAHLLEHVITKECQDRKTSAHDCITKRFKTVFTFDASEKDYASTIKRWATGLFVPKLFEEKASEIKKIIKSELETVDNEFNQRRNETTDSLMEVLTWWCFRKQIIGCGNKDTLSTLNIADLYNELRKLHKMYLQRRVAICVYSRKVLDMKLIVKSFNVGTFLDGMESTSKSAVRRSQTNTIRKAQYEGNCLIVVKTDDNRQELNIVFPLINEQTVQQTNTFKCIAEMLQCNNFGLLKYRLRLHELAIDCSGELIDHAFLITLDLTKEGLKHINTVIHWVNTYLQYMHDSRVCDRRFTEQMRKNASANFDELTSNMDKAANIVYQLDGFIRNANELKLYEGLSEARANDLISEHLLNSEKIVYMIFAGNKKEVLDILLDETGRKTVTTQKGGFCNLDVSVVDNITEFQAKDFKATSGESTSILYSTPIANPREVALQKLFVEVFSLYVGRFSSFFHSPTSNTNLETFSYTPGNVEERKHLDINDWRNSEEFNGKIFRLAKENLLLQLSNEMSSSEECAKSLLQIFLQNISLAKQVDPVPLQYETLRSTTFEEYLKYFERIEIIHNEDESEDESTDEDENEDEGEAEAIQSNQPFQWEPIRFHSINENEHVTATHIFYNGAPESLARAFQDECEKNKVEQNLYTVECTHCNGSADYPASPAGISIRILSVESKNGQNHEDITSICDTMCTNIESKPPEAFGKDLKKMKLYLKKIKKCRIMIQVVGYAKPKINEKSFNERFDQWIGVHRDKLEMFKIKQ